MAAQRKHAHQRVSFGVRSGKTLLPVQVLDVQVPATPVQISTSGTAYIIADDGSATHAPKMPQLTAQINGLASSSLQVEWKLDATFTPAPNGTSSAIHYPVDSNGNPTTTILPIGSPWDIYQAYGTTNFFGGACTLSYRILKADKTTVVQDWQTFPFAITGNNPDPATCKAQIIANEGAVWYAWAVAKNESADGSNHPYYNQFANGLANGGAGAHGSKGNPFHSPAEGDGWGLFQLDTSSGLAVTLNDCWSWYANMLGWLNGEYPGDLQTANTYVNGIKNNPAYASTFEEPSFTIEGDTISGRDILALTIYNGRQGRSNSTLLHFDPTKPSGSRWSLRLPNAPNKNDPYVNETLKAYNGG